MKKMNRKVSIIANFYKSEKFIPKLIESVIKQTYADWELICVNDCSPMNDLVVIQKYANKESRIIVVDNKTNLGISKAKFEGIKYATGKYLMFIDGDDWLEPEALERCVEPAEEFDVDMVVMSSQKVLFKYISLYKQKSILPDVNRKIELPELFDRYYLNFFGMCYFSYAYWGKLIRRDAFERANLTPQQSDYSEDLIFNMNLFPHLRSMYMLDYVGYNWRWGGITGGRLAPSVQRTVKLLSFVLDFYDMRLALLEKYNYEKGKYPLTVEFVNYLIGNIVPLASEENCANKEIRSIISTYIDKIIQNKESLNNSCGGKYDAIFSQDVDVVYAYCHSLYEKKKFWFLVKKLLHKLIF